MAGYFWDGSACTACSDSDCQTCSAASTCTKCISNFLVGGACDTCIDNNELKLYTTTTNTCGACIQNCDSCSDTSTCSKCHTGYYIKKSDSTSCIQHCNGNTQKIVGDYCYEVSDCSAVTNCLQCGSKNTCETGRCASGFYLAANGQCDSCDTGCLTCEDKYKCTTCDTPTYKLQASLKCVQVCDEGYFDTGSSIENY